MSDTSVDESSYTEDVSDDEFDMGGTEDKRSKRKAASKDADAAEAAPGGKKTKKPKKAAKKTDTLDDESGYELVKNYLLDQNRPYSATNIVDNLHKQVKRAQLERILTQLEKDNVITLKMFKKTKLYLANQDNMENPSESEMAEKKEKVAELSSSLEAAVQEKKQKEARANQLESEPTDEELETRIAEMTLSVSKLQEQIDEIGSEDLISKEDIQKLQQKTLQMLKAWKTRERACRDMVNVLADGMDKKPSEVMEQYDLEDDKGYNVDRNVIESRVK